MHGSSRNCKVGHCEQVHAFKTINGSKKHSSHCPDHTCRAPTAITLQPFCNHHKRTEDRYCRIHKKDARLHCHWTGCPEALDFVDHNGFLTTSGIYCRIHTCSEFGCDRSVASARMTYCTEHLDEPIDTQPIPVPVPAPQPMPVECRVDYCARLAELSGLCHLHECEIPACQRQVEGRDGRCGLHFECNEGNCGNFCHRTADGTPLAFCQRHAFCASPDCTILRGDGRFCDLHTCDVGTCSRGKITTAGAQFCSTHTCASTRCVKVVWDPTDPDSAHCRDHRCVQCLGPALVPGGCCEAHACDLARCGRPRDGLNFCDQHRCHVPGGCDGLAQDGYPYCDDHLCVRRGCDRYVRAGDELCGIHFNDRHRVPRPRGGHNVRF